MKYSKKISGEGHSPLLDPPAPLVLLCGKKRIIKLNFTGHHRFPIRHRDAKFNVLRQPESIYSGPKFWIPGPHRRRDILGE